MNVAYHVATNAKSCRRWSALVVGLFPRRRDTAASTPCRTLKARHVVYKTVDGQGEWWLSDKVTGGLVLLLMLKSGMFFHNE